MAVRLTAGETTMTTNRAMPPGAVIPELPYADVRAAARWLCEAFGFRERLRIGGHRIQLRVGDGSIVAVDGPAASGARVMVPVADVDAHYARAVAAGAQVSGEPTTYPYGERQYSAVDIGGHRWTFTQSVADSDPASWGGELIEL
jgi:uncharacterized glyoxalase superfamily protein PhnB